MKTHVRVLGWIYILTCGPVLACGLAICVLLALQPSNSNRNALQFIGPPFLIISCFALIPGLAGGIGLLRFRPWARVLILFLSAFLLPMLPLGTVWGLYGFWTLLNPETHPLFGRPDTHPLFGGSESIAARQPARMPSPLLNLFGVMAIVAAGFFLVLKIGFILHHDPQPAPISDNTLTATAVLVIFVGTVAATILIIQSGGRAASRARIRKDAQKNAAAYQEARRRRVAELAADPKRAKYAPLVERGEDWSEEKIAYNEDLSATATCEHLQPVERAMRAAGIQVRLYTDKAVLAKCRINEPELKRVFALAPPVRYAEFFQGERSAEDYPVAFLICDEHRSTISTVHPAEAGANDMPLFPM